MGREGTMTKETATPHDEWLVTYHEQLSKALARLADKEPLLSPLVRDAVMRGRKIRSALALQYAKWMGWDLPGDLSWLMNDLARVEFVHSASCIIDDIIDGDTMRRGLPSFHARNGMPQAILTSLLMLVRALQGSMSGRGIDMFLQQTMSQMIVGESWDSFLAVNQDKLPDDIINLYLKKSTASFEATFGLVAQHTCRNVAAVQEARVFGGLFGALYQMANDYYDTFQIPVKDRGKEDGRVLVTLSVPLCYLIKRDSAMRIALGQQLSFERFGMLVAAMKTSGAEQDTRDHIDHLKINLRTTFRQGDVSAELPDEMLKHMAVVDSKHFWEYKYQA